MRMDGKPQPPKSRIAGRKRAGRPGYYGQDHLMLVWLFVQEAMARKGWSANRACVEHSALWLVGGRGGEARDHTVGGPTLRSLYQRAVRVLKREREERGGLLAALRAAGASSPLGVEAPPLASWCDEELRRRLAQPG